MLEGNIDINKLAPHITLAIIPPTHANPLVIWLDDKTILKIVPHKKTDYDLCREHHGEGPAEWQGPLSVKIHEAIMERVPGHIGIARMYGSLLIKDQAKKIYNDLIQYKVPESFDDIRKTSIEELKFFFRRSIELIDKGMLYDTFCFIHMELCREYLRNIYTIPDSIGFTMSILRSTLFSVLFTYYKIKKYVPTWSHGDLHNENVMIIPTGMPDALKYVKYIRDDGKTWYIPYFGFETRIIDLGLSSIKELGIESMRSVQIGIPPNDDEHETKYLAKGSTDRWGANIFTEEHREKGITLDDPLFTQYIGKPDDPRENMVWTAYNMNP